MKQEVLAPTLGKDHPTVKNVIKIANDILKEGKTLNIDYLYRRAKRELKIPREGLLTIIKYLVNKKVIIDGSKFTKDTILDNMIRRTIYNFIQDNIGLHFSAMKRKLIKKLKGNLMGTGHLTWHIEMLLKFNLIKSIIVVNHAIFIPIDFDETIAKITHLARNEVRNKTLRYLIQNESSSKSKISESIEENRENVYYHIKILIENDLIIDKDHELYLNPKLKDSIINAIQYISHQKELTYKNHTR
jgi:predicted transcriptional regulator